jgi:hypothetical protein
MKVRYLLHARKRLKFYGDRGRLFNVPDNLQLDAIHLLREPGGKARKTKAWEFEDLVLAGRKRLLHVLSTGGNTAALSGDRRSKRGVCAAPIFSSSIEVRNGTSKLSF